MKTGLKLLLIAGLLVNTALTAQAQTSAPSAAPTGHMAGVASNGMHHGGMHHRMDPKKMEAKVAQHLAALKAQLKITPAQESAWNTFAAAMKPPARMTDGHPDPAEMERLTLPQRIDKMKALRAQHMASRQTQREQREEAVKAFYATLDNDQKSVMDAAHSKMMKRWGDRTGMGHGPHH